MACGMTPELMENIMKFQDLKDNNGDMDELEYDWTKSYSKWDKFVDPDEVKASTKSKPHQKPHTGCNHDHSAERRLMELSFAEKLEESSEFHVLGNAFFEQGQFSRSAYYYRRGLVYFDYMFPEGSVEMEQMDVQKLKLLLNFAACRLHTRDMDEVILHCNQAIDIDKKCVKAYYRRAKAYRLLDDYERSARDIAMAMELAPQDSKLRQEYKLLCGQKKSYQWKSRQIGMDMFGERKNLKSEESETLVLSKSQDDANWNPVRLGNDELEAYVNNN